MTIAVYWDVKANRMGGGRPNMTIAVYWDVKANRMGGGRPNMTIAVYWDVKQNQNKKQTQKTCFLVTKLKLCLLKQQKK